MTTREYKPFEEYELFKFKPISEHLIDALVQFSIWCPKPSKLNDPFDCQIDLKRAWARAVSKASGEHKEWLSHIHGMPEFFERWERQFSDVGVCSFTSEMRNALMWAHYADEHRGVCLLYHIPFPVIINPINKIVGIASVEYGDNTVTDWLLDDPPNDLYELQIRLTEIYLTSKAPDWHYEREVRLVRFNHGLFKLPTDCLVQVCFGMRTPDRDIERVKEAVNASGSTVLFCQMRRDKDTDFGYDAVEI